LTETSTVTLLNTSTAISMDKSYHVLKICILLRKLKYMAQFNF
jgi:hypothetical protein